jgi:small-conductance mechanosensitive channel
MHESWEKLISKLDGWLDQMVVMLPNVLLAIVALLVFFGLSKLIRKGTIKLVSQFSDNFAINNLLGRMVSILTMVFGAFVMLSLLQLDKTVTSLLAGAGIVGLAIGFAFQDMIANLISGVMIAIRKPFKRGDLIETNDYFGTVINLDLRNTVIRVPQGQHVIIPNKDVFQKSIKNYATGSRRIDLKVGVAYGTNLEKAEAIAKKAIESIPYLSPAKEVELHFTSFGDSSINFLLLYWIDLSKQADFFKAQSDGIKRVKAAFDEHEINIPFPIRTLELGSSSREALAASIGNHKPHFSNN